MNRTRTLLSWTILILALVIMVIPLPGDDDSHLLSDAEASDVTLVILTTEDASFIEPLVEQFIAETDARVEIETIAADTLCGKAVDAQRADIVLVHDIGELVPLMQEDALDTLPLDIMWNVDESFRDPAERWVGFSGRMDVNELAISGLALAQNSDSKPLAERFILYLYSRSIQEQLVQQSGQYSFLAFGVPTPAGMPELTSMDVPSFGAIYDSASIDDITNELAANQS